MNKVLAVATVLGSFLLGGLVGAAVGAKLTYEQFVHQGEAEMSGNIAFRLHTNALVRLDRDEEALKFQEGLLLSSLPYLSHTYSDARQMRQDLRANVSILRAYHERFPLPGLTPEMERWLVTVPDAQLQGCSPALTELLAAK